MQTLLQDTRYAFRMLVKSPSVTIVAILTLALGIGGTTSVLTMVNAVFLADLPFRNPDQLRVLYWTSPSYEFFGDEGRRLDAQQADRSWTFAWSTYRTLRDESVAFTDLACWRPTGSARIPEDAFVSVGAERVSGNYFEGMCCNFQKSARERLVGSTRLRLMQPLRTAC